MDPQPLPADPLDEVKKHVAQVVRVIPLAAVGACKLTDDGLAGGPDPRPDHIAVLTVTEGGMRPMPPILLSIPNAARLVEMIQNAAAFVAGMNPEAAIPFPYNPDAEEPSA